MKKYLFLSLMLISITAHASFLDEVKYQIRQGSLHAVYDTARYNVRQGLQWGIDQTVEKVKKAIAAIVAKIS